MDGETLKPLFDIAVSIRATGEALISRADDIGSILAALQGERTALVTAYSQNDPRWAGQIYAGGLTFATAGCYVTCVSMLASFAGYTDTPLETAEKLRDANCFNGAMLSYPQRIPNAYRQLEWPANAYWNRQGEYITKAKWEVIKVMIRDAGPLILKVDYRPENYRFNMHFILAVKALDDDLEIIDPIDGQRSSLLERYGDTRGWSARQAIFGYRGLRMKR